MKRAAALLILASALVGALALAQESGSTDFRDVDAALEALTRPATDTASVERTADLADDDAETETPSIDPVTGEPIEDAADGQEQEEATPLIENTWIQSGEATLRGLDKITGRSTDFTVTVGEPHIFGSLQIDLATCFARPPEQAPENAAFLTVGSVIAMETEAGMDGDLPLFSGWMFASSPGLNALEHSVYDVWVIACGASEAE